MEIVRRPTRQITVGNIKIGGDAPIVVQSMTVNDTDRIDAVVKEIDALEQAGCELVRVTVNTNPAADALPEIKRQIRLPLIADIHFDYRLALRALEASVDCLRINPGNIGGRARVERVVAMAKERKVPIRIGVNAGSLERDLVEKYGYPTAEAMVESAMRHIRILEALDFYDIKVSLKASHVKMAVDANRLFAAQTSYPIHLGITEAGTAMTGAVKSAVGLGMLLAEGIGDTIRVSLAADSTEEVKVAFEILKALELRHRGINVIACPTCGRVEFDVIKVANDLERALAHIREPITISVLGCVVNGIGEGKEADIGIAGGGRGVGLLFRHGEIVRKIAMETLPQTLMEEVSRLLKERAAEQATAPAPAGESYGH